MIPTPIFDQLVTDEKFMISPWPRDDLCTDEQRKALEEPWPDPWVVLPPSPEEARRVMAQRAGWDTQELDARAIRALSLVDAERTVSLITIEPAPEPEPAEVAPRGEEELVETEHSLEPPQPEPDKEKDNVDE